VSVTGPRATILIPVLRQQDAWLEHAIRSALRQTVPCEVLVITQPPTPPGNLGVIRRLQQAAPERLVVQSAPLGFAVALNVGFRGAAADRVGLLLSDDWLEPTAVEACLETPADIVSTGQRRWAADGQTELEDLRRPVLKRRFEELATLEAQARYLTHFFLFRRSKVLEVGGADETLGDAPGIDDYDLIWVLLEHGATVGIVEQYCYHYRDHEGERLTMRPKEELLVTAARILDKHGVTGAERERILAARARWFGRPIHVVRAELAHADPPTHTVP
jgi:glycosyltransferase involved in cell wall biosynthesis